METTGKRVSQGVSEFEYFHALRNSSMATRESNGETPSESTGRALGGLRMAE